MLNAEEKVRDNDVSDSDKQLPKTNDQIISKMTGLVGCSQSAAVGTYWEWSEKWSVDLY